MKTPMKMPLLHSIGGNENQMFAVFASFGTRRLSSKKPVIKVK